LVQSVYISISSLRIV